MAILRAISVLLVVLTISSCKCLRRGDPVESDRVFSYQLPSDYELRVTNLCDTLVPVQFQKRIETAAGSVDLSFIKGEMYVHILQDTISSRDVERVEVAVPVEVVKTVYPWKIFAGILVAGFILGLMLRIRLGGIWGIFK